jgi:hypothetical protein
VSFSPAVGAIFARLCAVAYGICYLLVQEQNGEPADKRETQRSENRQDARVGAVSAKMLLVFVLARKRR